MTTWERGQWLNAPPSVEHDGADLLVTAARGSDLWQQTSYGLRRDSRHARLAPRDRGRAVEVTVISSARGTSSRRACSSVSTSRRQ